MRPRRRAATPATRRSDAAAAAEIPASPGVYVVAIRLAGHRALRVGRLPRCEYEPGTYLYAGSAGRGLRARIARHLRADRRRHWHLDWLLEAGRVAGVWWLETDRRMECAVAARLRGLGAEVPGFGASDCQCRSHLVYAHRRQPAPLFDALRACEKIPGGRLVVRAGLKDNAASRCAGGCDARAGLVYAA